ncbi:M48 family metallopeptidase [Natronobacterium texcoconense]|uniref:Heat shock protein HtpX n=1 Tax=Natronobacterium texcoconense TaxID=1095778 RepID=A0A1H1ABL9_NATTX|nr:M56 family metallopeptidase [Natronobacterium texcoconense]SDQ37062.1 heat shock protein HtpX [Natronobacterium texcoconense]
MTLTPDRWLQIRIAAALVLVVGVNVFVLSVLAWSTLQVLSASGRSIPVESGLPLTAGAVLLGAIALVAVQARYGPKTVVSGLEHETVDGDGPRNVGARIRRLSKQADVPVPSVAVADHDEPNCLTVGTQRSPTIVVTTGLFEALDDDELDAALAHEIAHLVNHDLTVVSVVASVVAIGDRLLERERALRGLLVTIVAVVAYTFGALWIVPYLAVVGVLLLVLLVGPYLVIATVFLVVSAVARLLLGVNAITLGLFAKTREYAADRGASRLTGDPAAMASALETLEENSRPERDLRLDASATLGIIPQSLSAEQPDDETDDEAEGWFERWFVSQFRTWYENLSEFRLEERFGGEVSEGESEERQWQKAERQRARGHDSADDVDGDGQSWIVDPFVDHVVSPIRLRIRRVLQWRPSTHPATEARIEQLRTLERRQRD